jgi:hypothetical protein
VSGTASWVLSVALGLGQILNVTVQLFYMREESMYRDALWFLQVTTNVDLLTFRCVFIKDSLQMKHGTHKKMLVCFPVFELVLRAT